LLQVHNLWLLPIQVGIALTILYSVVGWSMLAGFMTMVGIVCLSTWSSRVQRKYQGFIMKARDKRMKATSEAMNAMKVSVQEDFYLFNQHLYLSIDHQPVFH